MNRLNPELILEDMLDRMARAVTALSMLAEVGTPISDERKRLQGKSDGMDWALSLLTKIDHDIISDDNTAWKALTEYKSQLNYVVTETRKKVDTPAEKGYGQGLALALSYLNDYR